MMDKGTPLHSSPTNNTTNNTNNGAAQKISPRSGFGRGNESHRTKRRDLNRKEPQRLHSVVRTDSYLDPSSVFLQHREARNFVKERSPDKTGAMIKKESVSKVKHRMSNSIMDLTLPADVNYVEDRSYFEADVDNTVVRRQYIAKAAERDFRH